VSLIQHSTQQKKGRKKKKEKRKTERKLRISVIQKKKDTRHTLKTIFFKKVKTFAVAAPQFSGKRTVKEKKTKSATQVENN
jgi:hypothetical protein